MNHSVWKIKFILTVVDIGFYKIGFKKQTSSQNMTGCTACKIKKRTPILFQNFIIRKRHRRTFFYGFLSILFISDKYKLNRSSSP